MATQLLFSRRQSNDREASVRGTPTSRFGQSEEPRHVAFAVHDAVPSPQLYLQQQKRQEMERGWRRPRDEEDSIHAREQIHIGDERKMGMMNGPSPAATKRFEKHRPTGKAALKKTSLPAKIQRKPGWDADVKTTSKLFDSTLKKSVLFQPRAGDRLLEAKEEEKVLSGHKLASSMRRTSSAWDARLVKSAPAKSQFRRPRRDFVKMNMEKITGQSYETLVKRAHMKNKSVSTSKELVFGRLAAPSTSKSLLRLQSLSPTRQAATHMGHTSPKKYASYIPTKLTISSPITARREKDTGNSEFDTLSLKRTARSRSISKTPSPSYRIPSPNQVSPGFTLDEPQLEERTMATRVFRVLDRYNRGRIGIDQILDGLKLIGLPATRNQVTDYVYLIHEGASDSIDIDDWKILVETLDAASHSRTDESHVRQLRSYLSPVESRYALTYGYSHQSSPESSRKIAPKHHRESSPLIDTVYHLNEATVEHAPANKDDTAQTTDEWYTQAIQRRVDEMYERAEQVVSSRNPISSSDAVLESAASAVYHLKSSLYPLVEQAELVLKDLKRRQATSLSLTLSKTDIAKVVSASDDLADMLLDELLVDTVEELNNNETQKAQEVARNIQSKALDDILQKIDQIEMSEFQLIKDGYLLAYSPQSTRSGRETTSDAAGKNSKLIENTCTGEPITDNIPSSNGLTLPLSAVLDVNLNVDPINQLEMVAEEKGSSHMKFNSAKPEQFENGERQESRNSVVSMTSLSGRMYERIEKHRMHFLKHRRQVEASLDATGMDQASVIEMLADLLLNEIIEDCAHELESGVDDLTLTLAQSLV